jgi:hypothetical protein
MLVAVPPLMMPMLQVVSSSIRPLRHAHQNLGGLLDGVDAFFGSYAAVRGFAVDLGENLILAGSRVDNFAGAARCCPG